MAIKTRFNSPNINKAIEFLIKGEIKKAVNILEQIEDTHLLITLSKYQFENHKKIGKLTKQTMKLISSLSVFDVRLNFDIDNLKNKLNILKDEADLLKEKFNQLEENNNQSIKNFDKTEELNSSLEKFSLSVDSINEISKNLFEITDRLTMLGKNFSNIEILAENTSKTLTTINDSPNLKITNKDFAIIIVSAINGHQDWTNKVIKMVERKIIMPLQTNAHKCVFGHYYYWLQPKNKRILSIWESVEDVHINLHSTGDKIIQAIKEKDFKLSEQLLQEVMICSQKIVGAFNIMLVISKDLNEDIF